MVWPKDGKKVMATLVQVEDNHVVRYDPPEKVKAESMVVAKKSVPIVYGRGVIYGATFAGNTIDFH